MDTVICFKHERLGHGDDELGRVLLRSFIKSLGNAEKGPLRLLFLNSGAKLTCEGSTVLEDLRGLANEGAEVLTCGTCLDYYHLRDTLRVGRATTMPEIVESLLAASRVIEP